MGLNSWIYISIKTTNILKSQVIYWLPEEPKAKEPMVATNNSLTVNIISKKVGTTSVVEARQYKVQRIVVKQMPGKEWPLNDSESQLNFNFASET